MNVPFAKPATKERRHFTSFYDAYVPNLWRLILRADLSASVSENIIINTFTKAWQHPHRQTVGGHQMLTWLLGFSYAEGLPVVTLPSKFRRL